MDKFLAASTTSLRGRKGGRRFLVNRGKGSKGGKGDHVAAGYPHNARLASSMHAFPMSLSIYSLSPFIYYSATSLPYLSTAPLIGPHRPVLRKRCVGRTVARRKEPGE